MGDASIWEWAESLPRKMHEVDETSDFEPGLKINCGRFLATTHGLSASEVGRTIMELYRRAELGDSMPECFDGVVKGMRRRRDARPIPPDVARFVRSRDGEVCRYCGSTEGPFHLDHVLPWSRGGKHTEDNLVVACAPCNLSKGDKTPEEWAQRG